MFTLYWTNRDPRMTPKGSQSLADKCSRCGKGPHFQQVCLAKDPVCHKCEKKGHYSLQCFTKAVTEVTAADAAPCDTLYDTSYLTAITDGKSNTSWNITVVVDELSATLVYKERSCTHPVYVVKSQAEPLWSTGNPVPQTPC